jgi:uncharacterized membrane protein YeaQ/YmgE (transglycosylase-associated protein family)
MGFHGSPWQGAEINFYIWIAIGVAAGFLVGTMTGSRLAITRIEDVLVGVFGAFIGGEFVASAFTTGQPPGTFTMLALVCAVVGALLMLVLLKLMRGAVGPLKSGKSRQKR